MQNDPQPPTQPKTPASPAPATGKGGGASASPAGGREDAPTLAVQRRAVRLLREAAAETAVARTELERVYAEKTAGATVVRDRVLKAAAERLASGLADAQAAHAAAVSAAEEALEKGRREAEAMRTRDRDVARERGQRDVEASKKLRDEAVWFAETCLDTDKTKIKAQRQADSATVAQMAGRVQTIKQWADAILLRWRQNLLVEVGLTPTESDAPASVFKEAVARAEGRIAEMEAYSAPRAIGGVVPWLIVFFAAAVGAVAGSALRGWAIDVYAGVGFLAGALVGGLIVFLIFKAVRARTRRVLQPLAAALAEARGAVEGQTRVFEAEHARRKAEAKAKFEADAGKARAKHDTLVAKVHERLADIGTRIEEAFAAATQKIESTHERAVAAAVGVRDAAVNAAEGVAAAANAAA
ncbi:MAG: hypothetical protein Q8L55_02975, partial [Phycisphaerales bacterium]|nr:hypothetical protein [Phycisphaerales bacterium]